MGDFSGSGCGISLSPVFPGRVLAAFPSGSLGIINRAVKLAIRVHFRLVPRNPYGYLQVPDWNSPGYEILLKLEGLRRLSILLSRIDV